MSPGPPLAAPRLDGPAELLARWTRTGDDEYVTFARRTGRRPPGRSGLAAFGAAIAILAALITVSALQTQEGAPQAALDRQALIDRLEEDRARVAAISTRIDDLNGRIEALSAEYVTAGGVLTSTQAQLDTLGVLAGSSAAIGPGVRVSVNDAPSGALEGTVLDTDLQLLANGLWQAGAEAIAVNGQRLTTLTAIRTAGQAVTVNFRSVSPPYVMSAVGDPATMPASFLETPAGQTFTDLQANFGLRFDVESVDELTLPAAGRLALRHTRPAEDATGGRP